MMRRPIICLFLLLPFIAPLVLTQAAEQVQGKATSFQVRFRYEIDAGRTLRFRLYQAMMKRLTDAGFKKAPGLAGEELYGTYMAGKLPATGVAALDQEVALRTAILVPEGFNPADDHVVLVSLQISTAFGPALQFDLANLARTKLNALGFEEQVGYDHHKQRRLLGRLAYGKLNELLKAEMEVEIPTSTRTPKARTPIVRLAEVIVEPNELPMIAMLPSDPEPEQAALKKVPADLRRLAAAEGDKPIRVEVILRETPPANALLLEYSSAPAHMHIEGRLGTLLTGTIQASDLTALASLPNVSTVRIPQAARQPQGIVRYVSLNQPSPPADSPDAWVRRGPGSKAVVVGHDFRGYKEQLSNSTHTKVHLVDLTTELSSTLQPQEGMEGDGIGAGTQLALDLLRSAPVEELVLLRIDTASPFQLRELAEAIDSGIYHSFALTQRKEELWRESARLESERTEIRVLRRLSLDNFGIDESAKEARDKYRERQRQFDESAKLHGELDRRMLELLKGIRQLKGAQTVLIGLNWTDGHPDLPGSPPTLRLLKHVVQESSASWIQIVPVRTKKVWTGLFRDQNRDGIMEFSSEQDDRSKLNFLVWQPNAGQAEHELPSDCVIQVILQWQEAHDPKYAIAQDDPYRQPVTSLQIKLLRQRDPSGQKLPADLFDVVTVSQGLPERVENLQRSAVYQATLRFRVSQPGRYALLIAGQSSNGIAPAGVAEIVNQRSEIHPKLIVETVDPAHRSKGSVQLQSYSSNE